MASGNTGAAFVGNYLRREWKTERKQTTWTISPNERDMSRVHVLYQFSDELDGDQTIFKGMQLIFEVRMHEEHPFKAPSIHVHTPNGRMETGKSICIDGLTAWHPESWNIITTFGAIIERFASAYIDRSSVVRGAGFSECASDEAIMKYAAESKVWNIAHYEELVAQFNAQCAECAEAASVAAAAALIAAEERGRGVSMGGAAGGAGSTPYVVSSAAVDEEFEYSDEEDEDEDKSKESDPI